MIAENIQTIKQRILQSAQKTGRDPKTITLIAVTKYVAVAQINEALRCGIMDIAENRVQDGQKKFELLVKKPRKHFIGTLQTNKARLAIQLFDIIHSVDRRDLVLELSKSATKLEREIEVLFQVNISGEASKHGANITELIKLVEDALNCPYLIPAGLMTIAPLTNEPEAARPIFRQLQQLFNEVSLRLNVGSRWRFLSMGMSQDYTIAIEEGANLLRIGTAIFKAK